METLALFVILGFAAYRITRLVVSDSFPPVQRLRDRLVGADETKLNGTRWEWFGELITCYWCAGFWVAGLVVGAADVVTSVPVPLITWWAVAGLGSFIAFVEDQLWGWSALNMKRAQQLDAERDDREERKIRALHGIQGNRISTR